MIIPLPNQSDVQIQVVNEIHDQLVEKIFQYANECRKLFGTLWYSKETGKTWKIIEGHREPGFYGIFNLILEDQSITYKGFKKFWFQKTHPIMIVPISVFAQKVADGILVPSYMWEDKQNALFANLYIPLIEK